MTTPIHGTAPAKQPKTKGSHPPSPGWWHFSCSQPKRIIDALTPKSASSATTSEMPTSWAMMTIISELDREYSTHRK